jgi:hypothetical protein
VREDVGVDDTDPGTELFPADGDPVGWLQRWEAFGAVWQVLDREATRVTVGLFRCDGGEEAGRFTSDDPGLIAFVAGRSTSEE